MRRTALVPVLFLAVACASTLTPPQNTRADLVAYVDRAAALVARRGPEAACTSFHEARWKSGEWYVFINRAEDSVLVCHPARPDLVGADQTNLQDVNGVYLAREMKKAADDPSGRGWVEYMWARPGETTPVRKSVYVVAVTAPDGKRYIVGSGGYEMP
ncbi:MAG TPA: cache domain-containing protein [Thermoanaerobaculia bacterium]|nr:cache domain-containing protein [Thermoanaerobaculia bacterium]